jgi:hypothetical protein
VQHIVSVVNTNGKKRCSRLLVNRLNEPNFFIINQACLLPVRTGDLLTV